MSEPAYEEMSCDSRPPAPEGEVASVVDRPFDTIVPQFTGQPDGDKSADLVSV